MDSLQVQSPSTNEKSKDLGAFIQDNKLELEHNQPESQSEGSLLPLPEPGTPERIVAERRLVRKLDTRLLPTIIIIYIMNYIDVCPLWCWYLS
jgi:hypothetical protein